jgi:hypothetical protein
MTAPRVVAVSHRDELVVLSLIGAGMILTVILVVCGIFGWFQTKSNGPLPNWAENVLVSVISIFAVKIGDVLAALVTLATGRQVESLGEKLSNSAPANKSPPPESAVEAAEQVAGAAEDAKDEIAGAQP